MNTQNWIGLIIDGICFLIMIGSKEPNNGVKVVATILSIIIAVLMLWR